MRKLILITNEFPPGPGGIGTHAFELVRQLQRWYQVVVIARQDYASPEQISSFNKSQNFQIYAMPVSTANRARMAANIFRKEGPEVVLVSGSSSVWIGTLMQFFFHFKMVVIAHGGELAFKQWLRRKLTLWGCWRADLIIPVSMYTAEYLFRNSVKTRISVIHNGANEADYFPTPETRNVTRLRYGLENRMVLLTVGSVTDRKGQDIVIRSLPEVLKVVPDIIYVMVGRSNDYQPFKRLSERLGLAEHVRFFGAASNNQLLEMYNSADAFILVSRHAASGDFEGFGIAVIEAALCGLPAIVSQDSGLVEAIEEGVTGISVKPEDVEETARAIIQLFTNKEFRFQLGASARSRAIQSFTWSAVGVKYHLQLQSLWK